MRLANARGLHSELLSFATHPTVHTCSEVAIDVDSPTVGPWPLKKESRLTGDEVPDKPQGGGPRRPTITPDWYMYMYTGKVIWNNYYQHFEACKKVNQWSEEQ